MRTKGILAILGISLLLLTSVATPALAGIEPQPWKPQINKLNAVANDLAQINGRLNDVLMRFGVVPSARHAQMTGVPTPVPAGVEPSPFRGAVGKLNAMSHQLGVLYDRVNRVTAVLGSPPYDGRLLDALRNVRDEAQAIVTEIRLGIPPGGVSDPRVREALGNVNDGAQGIINLIDTFLNTPGH